MTPTDITAAIEAVRCKMDECIPAGKGESADADFWRAGFSAALQLVHIEMLSREFTRRCDTPPLVSLGQGEYRRDFFVSTGHLGSDLRNSLRVTGAIRNA